MEDKILIKAVVYSRLSPYQYLTEAETLSDHYREARIFTLEAEIINENYYIPEDARGDEISRGLNLAHKAIFGFSTNPEHEF